MTNKEQWPEGATHKIEGIYTKWVGEDEYSFKNDYWVMEDEPQTIGAYWESSFEVIERPTEPAQYMPEVGEWCEVEIFGGGWKKARLEYKGKSIMVLEVGGHEDVFSVGVNLRPIKSERDVFIERAMKTGEMKDKMHLPNFMGVLYDNGARFGDE